MCNRFFESDYTKTDYYNYDTEMNLEFPKAIHSLCVYFKWIEYGLFGTSILHLTAITINRYVLICQLNHSHNNSESTSQKSNST